MTWLLPLAAAAAGAIVGSFIATLILRWPKGEQVVSGRSRCDHCHRELPAMAMVPIASYLFQRGRCGMCGGPIDPLHVRVEAGAAALAALAVAISPDWRGAAAALFWLLLIAPAILDLRHYWLPDRLTAIIAIVGLARGGVVFDVALADRVIGGLVGFLALTAVALAYRKARGHSGLGAGDPKLLGALGCWMGWAMLPLILLAAALIGLAFAVVLRRRMTDRLPFGTLMIAAAFLVSAARLAAMSLS